MQKLIDFSHCSRNKLVRDIEQFNFVDTSILRMESSEGMVFSRADSSSRSFLPIYQSSGNEDVELYVKFKQLTQTSEAFTNNGGALIFCSQYIGTSGDTAIQVAFGTMASSGTNYSSAIGLRRIVSNTSTTISTINISSKTTSEQARTWKHLKAKKTGSSYQVKAWWDGDVEPSYSATQTISGFSGGYFGVELSSRATFMQIQYLGIGVGEDAPMIPRESRKISGVIYKPDNTVASGSTVRLYHSYTGALLGSVVANDLGVYSFNTSVLEDELVQIVGVDQDNNEWKPPIHETYPVL